MSKKIYHLANCSTCQRIIGQIDETAGIDFQEIKTQPMTASQLDEMKALAGSYEALFSRRAMKYRSMGLDKMTLTEDDYRRYILEEYTFLKRPVAIIGEEIYVGSAKKTVEALVAATS